MKQSMRFFGYVPCQDDDPWCETPGCRQEAKWWEACRNLFLCDGCARRLKRQVEPQGKRFQKGKRF